MTKTALCDLKNSSKLTPINLNDPLSQDSSLPPGERVPLKALSVEQLQQLRQGAQTELEFHESNAEALQIAQRRLNNSKNATEEYSKVEEDQEIMIPLTHSIYVRGNVEDKDTVLVDIGTGYYVEKSPKDAQGYFERRIGVVKEQNDKVNGLLNSKRSTLQAVSSVLQKKVREAQAAGAASK